MGNPAQPAGRFHVSVSMSTGRAAGRPVSCVGVDDEGPAGRPVKTKKQTNKMAHIKRFVQETHLEGSYVSNVKILVPLGMYSVSAVKGLNP